MYQELKELTRNNESFGQDEHGRALCDFLPSCCPRLRRLVIARPRRLTRVVLRIEALEELEFLLALQLEALDVSAPNLLVLRHKA